LRNSTAERERCGLGEKNVTIGPIIGGVGDVGAGGNGGVDERSRVVVVFDAMAR